MIEINNLTKKYPNETVLQGLSLSLPMQTSLSILGKSGCGKSTLLKILSGLETADSGSFFVNNQDMFSLPPQVRGVVYLSQEPLLFPHLNVFENLAYGLRIRKTENLKKQVEDMAEQLEISEQLKKMPEQISGGQRQRVSFGRALIIQPRILLLDEPFAALDAETRSEMQALLKRVSRSRAMTALFVTHDLKEALIMGDQIAKMEQGQIRQYESVQAFAKAADSGVDKEIDFWKAFF